MYICEICKKEHKSITERNRCEADCLARVEAEKKRQEKEAAEEVKKARGLEITEELNSVTEKIESYFDDYGAFPDAISVAVPARVFDGFPSRVCRIFDKFFI